MWDDLPNGFTWDDWEPALDKPRSVVDMLGDLIRAVYQKTLHKQEQEGTSDEEATVQELGMDDSFDGTALFVGVPSDVGVQGVLQDQNYFFECPFSCYAYENFFGPTIFIGATNHLYEFGHDKYQAVADAINQNYNQMSFTKDLDIISSLNPSSFRYGVNRDNAGDTYGYLEYYTGAGGVLQKTIYAFRRIYTAGGTTYNYGSSPMLLYYTNPTFNIQQVNGENRIVGYTANGGFSTLGNDHVYLWGARPAMIITDDDNLINNYITNVDNTNQYHNTYSYQYDGDTYNIYYGDNYVVMDSPVKPFSYDDWRMFLLPVINDLNENSNNDFDLTFPTFEEIKYGDMGDFYIEPLHQYDKLPSAPSYDGSLDLQNYPRAVGLFASAYLDLIPAGLSVLMTGIFILAIILDNLRGRR